MPGIGIDTWLALLAEKEGEMFEGKSVLITGGTGTFGQAAVRRLLDLEFPPERVIIFSRDEFKQDRMHQALGDEYGTDRARLRFFLGDVRDRARLYHAFRGVDYVIHAAAMKQVPAAEYNPSEAIRTNIEGALNVVDTAIAAGVTRVVALSTDKACAPVNLYGATKLCMEKVFQAAGAMAGSLNTRFAVTRYGNVSGSRGSVIPFFLEQHRRGHDVVPVTDPNCTRFWMQPETAVDMVLQALVTMEGGELIVPALRAYRVGDLVQVMDLDAKVVGLRPGEKRHETMVSEHEYEEFEHRGGFFVRPAGRAPDPAKRMKAPLASDRTGRIGLEELRYLVRALAIEKEPQP